MLTTRAAHALLSAATTPDGLRALARALGFTGHRHVLGHRAAEAIGLPATRASRIVRDECTAALLIEDLDPGRWRESIQRVATHLDRLADARRWLIIAHCASDGPVVLACWLGSTHGPRVAVLRTTPRETLDSDAQTVAALAAAWHPDPTLTCMRWHELLGRHAIGKRFFREVHGHVAAIAEGWPARVHPDDRRTLALVHVARLLFLKFLETKGWLNGDRSFLANHAEHALEQGGALWQRLIAPLTFGTLNTPQRRRARVATVFGEVPFLNGGLFACSPVERRARRPAIDDALLAPLLLDTLARFRFTAREEARSWSEAAIDPDLLGRTFEAMMDGGERRLTGTFYTPARLVSTLVDDALEHALRLPRALVRDALDGQPVGEIDARRLREHIASLRVLDPACGSGGLLVATLERLAGLRQSLGDTRPIAVIRREILTQSIFGVDIAPMAVWLCELRLWLSIVIDDECPRIAAISPLPNLDHHIRIGDALGPHAFDDSPLAAPSRRLVQLRTRYASSTGAKKEARAARIDHMERECASRLAERALSACRHERAELLRLARQPTLFADRHGLDVAQQRRLVALRVLSAEHRRALRRLHDGGSIDFDFRTHFSDAAAQGGFDLVIGNPPWVRSHHKWWCVGQRFLGVG